MTLTNHQLLDESPALIAVIDVELRCSGLSPGWRAHLGIDESTVTDIGVEDLIGMPATPGISSLLESILADGEPVRDRREDIVPLAAHFLQSICENLGKEAPRLTKQQTSMMLKHPWPGNVRELRNVLERR